MFSTKLSLLVSLLLFSSSLACTCLTPSLQDQYYDDDVKNVVKAFVLLRTPATPGMTKYTLYINNKNNANFKGCDPSAIVEVYTADNSAACGVYLELFKTYVLPIREGAMPKIFLCDFIQLFSMLSAKDKAFLDTREKCCGSSCKCASGNPYVNCFRQPCSPPETAPCPEATDCRDNYCGPCLAEWFNDDGFPACTFDE